MLVQNVISFWLYYYLYVACCVCVYQSEFRNCDCERKRLCDTCYLCCVFVVIVVLVVVFVVTFQSFNLKEKTNIRTNKMFYPYISVLCVCSKSWSSKVVNTTSKCIKMNNLVFVEIFHMEKLANDKHINNKPIENGDRHVVSGTFFFLVSFYFVRSAYKHAISCDMNKFFVCWFFISSFFVLGCCCCCFFRRHIISYTNDG